MLPKLIQTEHLLMRPWVFEDVRAVVEYAADNEWSRYLPVPNPYTEEDARKFIAAQVLLDRQQHSSWAIEYRGVVSGGINLRFLADLRIGEMGYSIARELWGRGLAAEAAAAILDAAFNACPSLMRVRAMADARNVGSIRVLNKVGMKQEGILRCNRFRRDEPVDEVWCGIMRPEWEVVRRART
jgi:RimJ/RimL family protein N-acetyltransferase